MKIKEFYILLVAFLLLSCAENGIDAYTYQPPKKILNENPASYYLDATSGDDANDGTSPENAWKTLNKANMAKYKPGDKLLFKKGEVFVGTLEFTGEGTAEQRVFIDSYGDGTAMPVISGNGALYAVHVYNSTFVTIQNLEITNKGADYGDSRVGLIIECQEFGVSRNIVVNNLFVHDVNGSIHKSTGGAAIRLKNGGQTKRSRFEDMIIENCHIKDCTRNGITWSSDYWERGTNSNKWYPNKNSIVRNNLIEGVPGDGIVPTGCDNTLIEYNVIRDCTNLIKILPSAAAGIWPWSCDNTIIQFNEVSGLVTNVDGQGYDADYNCTNTLIQYNYSHDNCGGFLLLCDNLDQTRYVRQRNPIIRYNISINDGSRQGFGDERCPAILFSGPTIDAVIDHNIIHTNPKEDSRTDRTMVGIYGAIGYAVNPAFRSNIFYAPEQHDFELGEKPSAFEGNWYLGDYENKPEDKQMRTTSDVYRKEVIDIDAKGYKGLCNLMEKRTIGGKEHYFVKKEAIESFFERMEQETE